MPNPYLPSWEYIPDGEPRLFGERLYIYGSHDKPASDHFCDYRLKVWSASIYNLSHWTCHGDIFRTQDTRDFPADTDWSHGLLYAPDVIEKDGTYYLYTYILNGKGCVAAADRPEGPFEVLSTYQYHVPEEACDQGQFIDPGVLVDDDGKVYIYCGYTRSYMVQVNEKNMYEILDGTFQENILPALPLEEPAGFFEACSPRKIGNTYYLIYSPNQGSRLAYATSCKPTGPFTYRGYIVDNSDHYPAGNNHGSLCRIHGQWYIFYHRMTNGTLMSRRGCVEKINILEDGSIPTVEMTSLGFEDSLNPYEVTPADTACYLTGGCLITELNVFTRVITNIRHECVMGYKYFDFGDNNTNRTMKFFAYIRGCGCKSRIHILIDDAEEGREIGVCLADTDTQCISAVVQCVSGRHALFFRAEYDVDGCFVDMFRERSLFDLEKFVFVK